MPSLEGWVFQKSILERWFSSRGERFDKVKPEVLEWEKLCAIVKLPQLRSVVLGGLFQLKQITNSISLAVDACLQFVEQKGTDCKSSRDCQPYEICDKGSCQCTKGYVRYILECVPVKIYGEECSYDIQCNDDRMVCTNDEHDVQQKRFCVCDPYHLWNSTIQECLEIGNITQIAGNFREVYKVSSMIERSAQKVFLGVVIAGLIFVSILLSFIGICSVYGCCTRHKKGRYGEDDLGKDNVNDVAIIGLPPGTYEAIETDFSAMAI